MTDTKKITSDVVNAVAPHLIEGSSSLSSFKRTFGKILAEFVADVDEKKRNNDITESETRNLLRTFETMVSVSLIAEDVIKTSTKAKAANAYSGAS